MSENQRAILSEPVSSQHSGIVLVWSGYNPDSNAAEANNFNAFFVPKLAVAANPGVGWSFLMTRGGNIGIRKYVYINDASIVGNSANSNTSYALFGQTCNNRRMALRYVYGV